MRASQAQINQEVAVALERLNGLMQSTLDRVKTLEDDRREEDKRRDDRIEQQPDSRRANLAILISAVSAAAYVLTFLAAHWKP